MKESTARELTIRMRALAQEKATELASSSMKVPLTYYRDRSLWDWERKSLMRSTPIIAAPSAQVLRPGDYLVRNLLETSVLVTRDLAGRAHVFENYCSHRGTRLVDGCGNRNSFACPYHNWTYSCAGKLVGRPRAEGFDDLPTDDLGLIELASEERHGLIWCVLDPAGTIDVDEHLGSLAPELAAYDFGESTYVDHVDVEIECNWKAGLENYADLYHVEYVHKAIEGTHINDSAGFDRLGLHHRVIGGMSSLYTMSEEEAEQVSDDTHLILSYYVYPDVVIISSIPAFDIIQVQPGTAPGSCVLRHTQLARARTDPKDHRAIWDLVRGVFSGEDVDTIKLVGGGTAHSTRRHLHIGKNEMGVQHIIRTLRAAGEKRGG